MVLSLDRRCNSNSKSCDKQPALNPEVTWSIVAAEDPHPDGDDWRNEDKEGSPQGWEEGKTEGITLCPFILTLTPVASTAPLT